MHLKLSMMQQFYFSMMLQLQLSMVLCVQRLLQLSIMLQLMLSNANVATAAAISLVVLVNDAAIAVFTAATVL